MYEENILTECVLCFNKNCYIRIIFFSFVRSVSMDKWKDLELEKMKVGGNRSARVFFQSQSDYHEGMSIQEKYNSKAAALYRDKVSVHALLVCVSMDVCLCLHWDICWFPGPVYYAALCHWLAINKGLFESFGIGAPGKI